MTHNNFGNWIAGWLKKSSLSLLKMAIRKAISASCPLAVYDPWAYLVYNIDADSCGMGIWNRHFSKCETKI